MPKANRDYWEAKLNDNVGRDRRNDRAFADAGWTVVRVWEHQAPHEAAEVVAAAVWGREHRLAER